MELQTVPSRFVNDLVLGASRYPAFKLDWLYMKGLSVELLKLDNTRITMEKFAELYRFLAIQLDDEIIGLFSRPMRNGTLKYLCLASLTAPTLSVALNRFRNVLRLIVDDFTIDIKHISNDLVRIALIENKPLGKTRVLALELILMLIQGVSSWLIDKKIPFEYITFSYPRPKHATEYEHLYPGPALFNQSVTAFFMSTKYLKEPIRQNHDSLITFLQNAPLNWFYFSESNRPTTNKVRQLLQECMHLSPTVHVLAKQLHTSPRTLSRQLAAEGTSFQVVKDRLRRDMAIDLLNKTRMPAWEIGMKIGFQDPAAFNRAFKQWTGSAPGVYRKHAGIHKIKQ